MLRLLSFLALMLPLASVTAQAQQYPDHPVRVIVGSEDVYARLFRNHLVR